MKSVERELEQLRLVINALARHLRQTPPHIWDGPTCRGVADVLEGLADRSAMMDASAPPAFVEQAVRELVRETITTVDDRAVGEALKRLALEATLSGHDLTQWRERQDGDLVLSCRRCGQEVRVNAMEIKNDLAPACPAFVADV